jgi:hypothetical protein
MSIQYDRQPGVRRFACSSTRSHDSKYKVRGKESGYFITFLSALADCMLTGNEEGRWSHSGPENQKPLRLIVLSHFAKYILSVGEEWKGPRHNRRHRMRWAEYVSEFQMCWILQAESIPSSPARPLASKSASDPEPNAKASEPFVRSSSQLTYLHDYKKK